ncbi:MAG TPA: PEGA domain-containing protein [Terriglobales bacterium]|nr:PEGA domain-containing protein [Terriglobales bacterium]
MSTADLVQGVAVNPTPSRIGRFALGQELGRGRMGAVYKATDTQNQCKVAMRIVHMSRFSADPDVARLRLREAAKAAGGLNSPNIASLVGGGELQELFYLTLEYIPGTTLLQRLGNGEKFSTSEFLDIARQLCAGLEHAHARKIFHGNLVPWNLIFEDDGTLKILDFGLAHSLVASDAREDVAYLPYLPPELLRGQPPDAHADLFSAACILYEVLTGKKAFSGSSREQIALNILNGFAPPAHESSTMIHPGLSAVLAKALAKDPNDRYQRAADLIRELEGFQSLGTKQPAAKAEPPSAPTPKPARVSAYGVSGKPVITPKPMAAPAVESVPSRVIMPRPVAAPVPLGPPSEKVWIKPAPKSQEVPAEPEPAPIKAPAAPGKKPAMLLAGFAAILLVVMLIALWNTRDRNAGPGTAATKEPTSPKEETVLSTTPAEPSPARTNPATPAKRRTVGAAPAPSLPAAPATGELVISVEPAGTLVQIDDGASEPGPLSKTGVPAGSHTVIFSKPGYVSESRKVDVAAGGKALVAASLQPRGAFVTVASQPAGATILVDGKESGLTPAKLVLSEGQHNITVRKEGYLPQSAMPTLARGQEFKYSPELMTAGSTTEVKTVGKFKKIFGSNDREMGMVEVRTNPKGAAVTVNGQAVPKPAPVTFLLNPGNYEIEVRMDGYRTAKRVISLEKGGQVKVEELLAKN